MKSRSFVWLTMALGLAACCPPDDTIGPDPSTRDGGAGGTGPTRSGDGGGGEGGGTGAQGLSVVWAAGVFTPVPNPDGSPGGICLKCQGLTVTNLEPSHGPGVFRVTFNVDPVKAVAVVSPTILATGQPGSFVGASVFSDSEVPGALRVLTWDQYGPASYNFSLAAFKLTN